MPNPKGPTFDGIQVPRHVELPPEVVEAMPWMEKAELKVVIAVLAYPNTPLSMSILMELTRLSRQGVRNGVADALKRGLLERAPVAGKGGQTTYAYSIRYATSPSALPQNPQKGGLVSRPPAPIKLSIVIESLKDLKQYLTSRDTGGLVSRLPVIRLPVDENDQPNVSRRSLDDALKSAGVYSRFRKRILDQAETDPAFAARLVLAIHLYPLAQELGIADGAGWLVEAISGDWNLEEMAEDYLERVRARAEQRNARESLPEDILQGLEKIGYTSGFTEVARAFQEDPRRVRGWLLWAEDEMERDPDHAAARFRQAIRSGQHPPESATLIADLFDGV